jgi:hypothetical protein
MSLSDQMPLFETSVAQLLGGEVSKADDGLAVRFARHGYEASYTLPKEELAEIGTALSGMSVHEDTILYDSNSLEMPVAFEGRGVYSLKNIAITKSDPDNQIAYTLGLPSKPYRVFFLNILLARSGASQEARLHIRRRIQRGEDSARMRRREASTTFFDYLAANFSFVPTLKVASATPRQLTDFLGLVSGFIFQFSYNTSIPVIEMRFLDQILRSARMERIRRSSLDEIEPPRRVYIPDLVGHYQMGLSTDSPPLQFLSFYHIAAHFFEAVYTEDMIQSVIATLTGPGFSYRRRHDILALIKTIRQRVRTMNEREVYNEEESLRLVIRQYVNFPRMKAALASFDPALPDYYKITQVGFSEAPTCDLDETDLDRLTKRIASRVYKTRNAIVHSKEGGKARYMPFQHDRELLREIPLLRFLAECLCENASSSIAKALGPLLWVVSPSGCQATAAGMAVVCTVWCLGMTAIRSRSTHDRSIPPPSPRSSAGTASSG